jgi:STAM-binding protein
MCLDVVFMFAIQSLLAVLDELESLKPEFQRRVDELNNDHSGAGLPQLDGLESTSFGSETHSLEWPAVNRNSYLSVNNKRVWTQLVHLYYHTTM